MDLRLNNGDQYIKDLRKIVNAIRANGSISRLLGINIIYPGAGNLELFICAQFEQNVRVDGSLYVLGFENDDNTFSFNIPDLLHMWGVRPVVILDAIDGSYRSLDCANALPDITFGDLISYIQALSNYRVGNFFTNNLKKSLARLIIITSESFRSNEIAQGVVNMLYTGGTYKPNSETIHNWGGRLLNSM